MAEQDAGELVLTYAELGDRLGVTPDGARTRAKRAGWPITVGNDGKARVRLRAAELPEQRPMRARREPELSPVDRGAARNLLDRAVAEAALARSSAEQATAELAHLRVELGEAKVALARAEERVRSAEAVAVADVAAARSEVEAKEAVIAELREQVAWLRRPWWRRALGR